MEVVAGSGFDWLLLDTEHSPNDLESVLSQLQAASQYSVEPVVRVAWNDMVAIKRLLDIGVRTLLIPMVQNADEARAAVSYTRYPPEGAPGFLTPVEEDARRILAAGGQFVAVGANIGLLARSTEALAAKFK